MDGIVSDHKELVSAIVKFKDGLESAIEVFDHIPLPPVYSQVHKRCLEKMAQMGTNWINQNELYLLHFLRHPKSNLLEI